MRKICILLGVFILVVSCVEKIIEKPETLISEGKMIDILYDVSVLIAAKNSNKSILVKNNIETMDYIYMKYSIDSLQFVKSDEYYASIPADYLRMYEEVETRLDNERIRIQEEREQKNDSIGSALKPKPKSPKKVNKPLPNGKPDLK